MQSKLFLINRKNPMIAIELIDVPLTSDEENFLKIVHHAEKRAELRDRRKALRLLLSRNLNISPELIPLSKGSSGEIRLEGIPLYISVASRGHHIAIAWGHKPLGVDVETSIHKIPTSALHESEIQFLSCCLEENRPRKTALLWAAKEAAWKSLNLPLTADPKNLQIQITESGEARALYETKNIKVFLKGNIHWISKLNIAVAMITNS